jgi:hypothetical protein
MGGLLFACDMTIRPVATVRVSLTSVCFAAVGVLRFRMATSDIQQLVITGTVRADCCNVIAGNGLLIFGTKLATEGDQTHVRAFVMPANWSTDTPVKQRVIVT